MTEENNEFFDDIDIEKHVEGLWSDVFRASNKLIKDSKIFAFGEIESLPKPNIHQMLKTLTIIDSMLGIILTLNQNGKINIEDTRLILNAKQQILLMESVATALKNKDKKSYIEAISQLEKQAPI